MLQIYPECRVIFIAIIISTKRDDDGTRWGLSMKKLMPHRARKVGAFRRYEQLHTIVLCACSLQCPQAGTSHSSVSKRPFNTLLKRCVNSQRLASFPSQNNLAVSVVHDKTVASTVFYRLPFPARPLPHVAKGFRWTWIVRWWKAYRRGNEQEKKNIQ